MEDKEIKKMLAMNHEMLMVLEHFQLAKLDYAKNIKIYTSIPQANVQIYIERLYSVGLIEKYMGVDLSKAKFAVQGFGNAGQFAVKFVYFNNIGNDIWNVKK